VPPGGMPKPVRQDAEGRRPPSRNFRQGACVRRPGPRPVQADRAASCLPPATSRPGHFVARRRRPRRLPGMCMIPLSGAKAGRFRALRRGSPVRDASTARQGVRRPEPSDANSQPRQRSPAAPSPCHAPRRLFPLPRMRHEATRRETGSGPCQECLRLRQGVSARLTDALPGMAGPGAAGARGGSAPDSHDSHKAGIGTGSAGRAGSKVRPRREHLFEHARAKFELNSNLIRTCSIS